MTCSTATVSVVPPRCQLTASTSNRWAVQGGEIRERPPDSPGSPGKRSAAPSTSTLPSAEAPVLVDADGQVLVLARLALGAVGVGQ